MKRRLVTEADVREAAKKGLRMLSIEPGTIITPSARDEALRLQIEFSTAVQSLSSQLSVEPVEYISPIDARSSNASTVIALGSDHGGFQLKETLKRHLTEVGYTVADVGTRSEQPCDYPDFAYAVASLVANGQASKGIMIDAVGVASAIVANKVPGIRAVPCTTEFAARSSREHNDANVLTLGGRVMGAELAKSIVRVWLETWFGGGRHQARVQKISDVERKFAK
jgi:ribose 5-phosphate isomerase B